MLQPPRALRDTFELLALLQPDRSLESLLDTVDWQGATPHQVSHAVLGRMAEDIHYYGLTEACFDAKSYFTALLSGAQFQSAIVQNLLGAFPEKKRRFFVHVPRCGGTSLGETLALHACTIPHNAIGANWSSGRDFLDLVADICRAIPHHDAIHISGHYPLRFVVDKRLARYDDSIWSSVRPPQEIILSYMNYILTVLDSDPEFSRPDTRHWADLLGLEEPLSRLSAQALRALLPKMAREDLLIPKDLLCHFLGDGTAASALDLLAATNVEVIDSARLDHWREQRWKVPAPPWRNISKSFFRWGELDRSERQLLGTTIRQDKTLHKAILAASDGAISVRGLQIARHARAQSLTTTITPTSKPERKGRAARPILLDPSFPRLPSAQVGWADPPLNYHTIETTLRFPLIDMRIRVRYARRKRRPGLSRLLDRLGTLLVRRS